jgi:ankyrin repeat protein
MRVPLISLWCLLCTLYIPSALSLPQVPPRSAHELFNEALAYHDFGTVRRLIDRGEININAGNHQGITALLAAIDAGDKALAAHLIKSGANVNTPNNDGYPPLAYAANKGDAQTVQLLLHNGAVPDVPGKDGFTPLMIAASLHLPGSPEVIQALLKAGANPNWTTPEGITPLMIAADKDQGEAALLLLTAGADPTARDNSGHTALDYAQSRQSTHVLPLLEKKPEQISEESSLAKWIIGGSTLGGLTLYGYLQGRAKAGHEARLKVQKERASQQRKSKRQQARRAGPQPAEPAPVLPVTAPAAPGGESTVTAAAPIPLAPAPLSEALRSSAIAITHGLNPAEALPRELPAALSVEERYIRSLVHDITSARREQDRQTISSLVPQLYRALGAVGIQGHIEAVHESTERQIRALLRDLLDRDLILRSTYNPIIYELDITRTVPDTE